MSAPDVRWVRDNPLAAATELLQKMQEVERLELHLRLLRHPFRNADSKDWGHLMQMIPDSGHGKFWKAVMTEMRGALDLTDTLSKTVK